MEGVKKHFEEEASEFDRIIVALIPDMRRSVSETEIETKWIPKYYAEDHPAKLIDQVAWLTEIGFVGVDVIWKRYNFAVYGGSKPE